MRRRRAALAVIVVILAITDGILLFNRRYTANNAVVTHIGIDSLEMVIPMRMRAAKLRDGKWDIDPMHALKSTPVDRGKGVDRKALALVSLAPTQSYGQAITVIRDLKARNICNVLIREGGRDEKGTFDFPEGADRAVSIPAIVLCGSSVGDAGFTGDLETDGPFLTERPH